MVVIFKKVFYCLSWVVWLIFCYFLSQFIISFLSELSFIEIQSKEITMLVISLLVYLATLVLFVLGPWLLRKKNVPTKKITELLGLNRRIKIDDFKKGLGTYLIYMLVLVGVMMIFNLLFPELSAQEQDLGFAKTGNNPWQLIVIFLSLVVVPPVFEELIMRGVLFGQLRSKVSFWPAAIIVSILFAIAHGQINVAVDTFILSLFLCNLREKTGAIWAPIIVHTLKNLLGFYLIFVTMV